MTEKYVYTHITGRTTEESLQFSHIQVKCVRIGRQITLLLLIPKAVLISTNASILMDGKSKNIIQTSLR